MNKLVASSIAIALFLVAGCAPRPATLTVGDLYGTWTFVGRLIFQFKEDGTFVMAASIDELTSRPL